MYQQHFYSDMLFSFLERLHILKIEIGLLPIKRCSMEHTLSYSRPYAKNIAHKCTI